MSEKIQVFGWSAEELEHMMRQEIQAVLGPDKDALKAFEVKEFKPQNAEQAIGLARVGKPLFVVQGALGLDDSGVNMRAFSYNHESGLSTKRDREIARQLGWQCKICVAKMKRERRANPGLAVARA